MKKSFRKSQFNYKERGRFYRNNKCGLWHETSNTSVIEIFYIVLKEKQTARLFAIDKTEYSNNERMFGNYGIIDVKSSF